MAAEPTGVRKIKDSFVSFYDSKFGAEKQKSLLANLEGSDFSLLNEFSIYYAAHKVSTIEKN